MRGLFITFEGIEGCGKSTQTKLLAEYFRKNGEDVFLSREPGGPNISEKIREILLANENSEMLSNTEVLLYAASRSQHTGEWILPELKAGKIVICDRYFDSTTAYQGAARKIDRKMIDTITSFATFGLKPDITVWIDLAVSVGLARISPKDADRLESESLDFHKKVREGFLQIAKTEKRFIVVDGSKSIAEISNEIINKIEKRLKNEDK